MRQHPLAAERRQFLLPQETAVKDRNELLEIAKATKGERKKISEANIFFKYHQHDSLVVLVVYSFVIAALWVQITARNIVTSVGKAGQGCTHLTKKTQT